jgi:localization factor PodJL
MNSRVSWSVEGIEPSVRERAEAAARRAGMSLNDWLNSTIGDTPPNFRKAPDQRGQLPSQDARNVAEIHQRLDSITHQIEQISSPAGRTEPPVVARQLNDAISRLDARLSQISNPPPTLQPQPQPQPQEAPRKSGLVEPAAGPAYTTSPPISPVSLDSAIAEITARQNELDGTPLRTPRRSTPPIAPPPAAVAPAPTPAPTPAPAPGAPDIISGLERQLLKINSQIETLRRPDGIEQSIVAFRVELAEIRNVITEAVPRRALESIENEVRSLSRRIDDTRQSGIDGQALAGVERALGDIREALRSLTPAEQLAGFDEAIRNLGGKIDLIVRDDPDALQQLEGAIAALRAIVANVASNDTLTRLGGDLQALSSRVDQLAQSGGASFAALERRIAELTTTLESRERPAVSDRSDQLEGALRALSERIEHLPDSHDSSTAFAHIEGAVRALSDRFDHLPVSHDGSAAFAHIEGAVRALSDRLDRLPASHDSSAGFAHIESAVRALSDRLDHLPVSNDSSAGFDHLAGAVRALSDRLDHMSVGNDSSAAIAHLEQRVSYLLERLEKSASDPRAGDLGRVEQGLHEILRHLERQQSSFAALTDPGRAAAGPMDGELADTLKRELSEMRFSQSEIDRHTQDSLEVVHNTLGHVVDRLAMIEGDLRTTRAAPVAPQAATPQLVALQTAMPRTAAPMQPASQPRPELPNPAASQFVAAPRQFGVSPAEPAATTIPKTISDILDSHGISEVRAASTPAVETRLQPTRAVIDPELPPDHPLEPGTRPHGRIASPSERIAASENAISEISSSSREPASTSNFIAAARRAAQAAAAAPAANKASRGRPDPGQAGPAQVSTGLTSKIRAFLVAASVVVIVLSSFKMAMTLLEGSPPPPKEVSSEAAPLAPAPAESESKPATPAPVLPSLTSPTPIGRQPMTAPSAGTPSTPDNAPAAAQPSPAAPATDVTGTVAIPQASAAPTQPPSNHKLAPVPIPASERLPDAIGGPALRTAALKGDASAAYEIGVRYAEGKGVAVNFDEAAKWYDRAAQAGVVPAVFRLGTLYEKGLSVKRDLDAARRYYLQAAERGNAKAMHNLAVLDADGGTKGADYKSAAQWFRKAAERGVADSQFNLGILYARGIGVEQNLAESFKWFSLAAAQGDADSGRKRDDVAKRLDPQSLAAATLAIQTFVPEGQPDDAVNVASPPGGWDSAPTLAAAAKRGAKPVSTRRVAAEH